MKPVPQLGSDRTEKFDSAVEWKTVESVYLAARNQKAKIPQLTALVFFQITVPLP